MGFARAASRAFSRITPKAWRGKKKTENFDLPRDHSESKQSYVNLVGSHRDAKGKVRKYDLISDQDTGDLYVANYSSGKTKYIHSGNVIKDHTAVDFGTFDNKQRAKVHGQYSGLDATVKYLKDNGIHVEGLDRTMGTAKSPKFTGSLIDPRSRHTIGSGYGPNTDSHRNYVPLDALNDLQKSWRATQNKPGDPPSYGSGPAPKQPNGPKKPSGPRFSKQNGNPFNSGSSKSPLSLEGPPGTGTTPGPAPSQNQAGKGWRAQIRVPKVTATGSADKQSREQPQDIASEMKALGFTPQGQKSSKTDIKWGQRKESWPENIVEMTPDEYLSITGNKSPRKPETLQSLSEAIKSGKEINPVSIRYGANGEMIEQEGNHRAMAARAAGAEKIPVYTSTWKNTGGIYEPVNNQSVGSNPKPHVKRVSKLSKPPVQELPPETAAVAAGPTAEELPLARENPLKEVFAPVKYPHKRMVEERLNTELPSILKEGREDTPESKPLTRDEELALRSHMEALGQAARDTTQRKVGGQFDPTKSKKYIDESKYRTAKGESDTQIEGADALSGIFGKLADESQDPALAKLLKAVGNNLSAKSANLKSQKKALSTKTPAGKRDAAELAERLRNQLDPQQVARATQATFAHPMKTGVTNDIAVNYAKATGQNNSKDKPEDIRGLGLREFEVPSPFEDLSAKTKDRLAQVPRDFEDDQQFNEFLAGTPARIGNSKDVVRAETPLDIQEIKKILGAPESVDLHKEYADQIAIPLSRIKGAMESQALLTRDFNTAKASELNMLGADIHEGTDTPSQKNGSRAERMNLQDAEKDVYKSESDMYAKLRDQFLAQAPQRLEHIDRSLPIEQQRLLLRDAVSQDLHSELNDHVLSLRNPEGDTSGKPNVFRLDRPDIEDLIDTTPENILAMANQGDPIEAVNSYLRGKGVDVTQENVAAVIDMYDKGKLAQDADFHAAALQQNPEDEVTQNLASTVYNHMQNQGMTIPGTVSPFEKSDPAQSLAAEVLAREVAPPASLDEIAGILPEGVQVSDVEPSSAKLSKGLRRSKPNKPI